jgi:hypothetical protein
MVSVSCRPTVYSGFSEVSGSWKIAPIWRPRICASVVGQVVDALAFEQDLAAAMRPGGSSRPMMAAPVSDLPAPDSPTTPRISPGCDVERDVVQRQQRAAARGELDAQVADFEQRSGHGSAQARVQGVAQPVAQQVHGQRDQHQHRHPGRW